VGLATFMQNYRRIVLESTTAESESLVVEMFLYDSEYPE